MGRAPGRGRRRRGDSVNAFFVAAPFQNVNGPNTGRVYLLSARTAQVLYRIDSP